MAQAGCTPWAWLLLAALGAVRGCEDTDEQCRFWASTGECGRNWDWMAGKCPNSCGACLGKCEDSDEACEDWASNGECQTNHRYMAERCPAACGGCPILSGAALECDSCIAMQEAMWKYLRHVSHGDGDGTTGSVHDEEEEGAPNGRLTTGRLKKAVEDVCVAHEWMSFDATLPYQRWCEHSASVHRDALVKGWQSAIDESTHGALPRSVALKMKFELCASPPPGGFGACGARQVSALKLGAPVADGACGACKAFVSDAVTNLRRGGVTVRDESTADYRKAFAHLRGVCASLELRHNATPTDSAAHARAAAKAKRLECHSMQMGNYDTLGRLVYQWPHSDVEAFFCNKVMRVCKTEEEAPVKVEL